MTTPPVSVLVVDDDKDNREGVAEYLSALGYAVAQAASAAEAIDEARRLVPQAVILDLQLPAVDGFTIARELRSDPATSHVFIVAFSACVFPEDRARAFASGCDEFIEKPAPPSTIVKTLQRLLSNGSEAGAGDSGARTFQ